jgi:two-component system, OmpR family, sensor histidine kinase KdpD
MHYVWSTIAVAAAVLAGVLLSTLTSLPNLSMIFLMAVLLAAVRFGMWPAVYASVLSFLAYNFFFIEPRYTFAVAEPHELLALVIFLVVAVTASALAGRIRDQVRVSAERMRSTRRLYEFTRKLSGLADADAIAGGAAGEVHTSLARPTVVLLNQGGKLALAGAWPPDEELDAPSMSAAEWAFACKEPVGAGTSMLATVPWLFVPLRARRESVGVVGVACKGAGASLDSEARALLDTMAEQVAAALERASLGREMVSAQAAAETERVRNTLLASISHDFRTPLASILGAATSLIEYGDRIKAPAQCDLLGQIKHEAEGLDQMVRNLLAIARIDAGSLELRCDWVDLRDVVERVVSAARRRRIAQRLEVMLPTSVPMIRADATLVEQALGNVVSNAVLHTPAETRIVIDAAVDAMTISLRVADDGPGIPAEFLPRAFDKFARPRHSKPARADGGEGSGLGLAIAKGIVEAHRGTVAAESPINAERGTRVILTFPREDKRP